jgi:ABC-type proline/glycine betaine transport system substrate-binding protein
MKNLIKLSFLVLIITLSACSANHIEYDKQVDFRQYKTFAYYKKGINALKIPVDKKKYVLKTVSSVLKQKGFSKSSHPDLIVNVFTSLADRLDVYPGYYAPWGGRSYAQESKEGTIYIDIVDVKAKRVIWSGNRYIDLRGNDYRTFRKAISKLLNDFPPNN